MSHFPCETKHHYALLYCDTKNKKSLFITMALRVVAIVLGGGFIPAILYSVLGLSLWQVCLYYAVGEFATLLFLFPSALIVSRYGSKIGIFLGSVLLVPHYIGVYLASIYPELLFFLPFWGGSVAALYYVSFHLDMSEVAHEKNNGKKVAFLNIAIALSTALAPLIGGIYAEVFDPRGIVLLAAFFAALAGIPALFSSKKHKPIHFSATTVWKNSEKHLGPRSILAFSSLGVMQAFAMTIWPLLLFTTVGSFGGMGAIMALTTVVIIVAMYATGNYVQSHSDRKVLKSAVLFQEFTWVGVVMLYVLELFTLGAVVVSDCLRRFGMAVNNIPMDHAFYRYTRERGKNPLHGVMVHEVGLHGAWSLYLFLLSGVFYMLNAGPEMLILGAVVALIFLPFQIILFQRKRHAIPSTFRNHVARNK